MPERWNNSPDEVLRERIAVNDRAAIRPDVGRDLLHDGGGTERRTRLEQGVQHHERGAVGLHRHTGLGRGEAVVPGPGGRIADVHDTVQRDRGHRVALREDTGAERRLGRPRANQVTKLCAILGLGGGRIGLVGLADNRGIEAGFMARDGACHTRDGAASWP